METHQEWIGGLKSRVSPLKSLVSPLNRGLGSAKSGSDHAMADCGDVPAGGDVQGGDLGRKAGIRTRKWARGRIELPTRGFSVRFRTIALGYHRPASDNKRYSASTSAARKGGRCTGVCSCCFVLRGTVGGQWRRVSCRATRGQSRRS